MKQLILCSILLLNVHSKIYNHISAILTHRDIDELGNGNAVGLNPNNTFRVYAVYDSSATSPQDLDYLNNVKIRSNTAVFSVAELAASNSSYFLRETNFLTSPIYVNQPDNRPSVSVPFTIYMASTEDRVAPVISAQLVNGPVDCSLAKMSSDYCTVLSAESNVQLKISNFDSKVDRINVLINGFDMDWPSVFEFEKDILGSSVVMPEPIFTLVPERNREGPLQVTFDLEKNAPWSGTVSPGLSTAFINNGYINESESYHMDHANPEMRSRSYTFGKDVAVHFWFHCAVEADKGAVVTFTCLRANGTTIDHSCQYLRDEVCMTVSLNVTDGTMDGGARFAVQMFSESGASSTSLFVLFMLSLLGFMMK